jgi:mono/diheme cytochrome c family protein
MKRLALVIALALAGCSRGGDAAPAESGLSIFHTRCARCHGADGRGNAVFNTPVLQASQLSVAEMEQVIASGRGKMPSFRLELTPPQITAVAGYIKRELK